jgi:flagellar hook-associated protein 3 FlgL
MAYDRTRGNVQSNLEKLYHANEQLSSGLRINKPSDDTIGITRVLDYKVEINANTQYLRSMDDAKSYLEFSETVLSAVTENLTRLNEILAGAASGQVNATDRQSIAQEVSVIKDQMFSLANSRFGDRYVFSGYKTATQTFTVSNNTFINQGDANLINVNISRTATLIENVTASDAFAYSISNTQTMRLSSSSFAHYIPTIGSTTITVRIGTSSDPTVTTGVNQFSYSNFMDMTQQIQDALNQNDTDKLFTLMKAVQVSLDKNVQVRAKVGARLNVIDSTQSNNEDTILFLHQVKSSTEDADTAQTISDVSKAELALQSLRQSSMQMLQQSLLDFLK